jgi:hypothetical protein
VEQGSKKQEKRKKFNNVRLYMADHTIIKVPASHLVSNPAASEAASK